MSKEGASPGEAGCGRQHLHGLSHTLCTKQYKTTIPPGEREKLQSQHEKQPRHFQKFKSDKVRECLSEKGTAGVMISCANSQCIEKPQFDFGGFTGHALYWTDSSVTGQSNTRIGAGLGSWGFQPVRTSRVLSIVSHGHLWLSLLNNTQGQSLTESNPSHRDPCQGCARPPKETGHHVYSSLNLEFSLELCCLTW